MKCIHNFYLDRNDTKISRANCFHVHFIDFSFDIVFCFPFFLSIYLIWFRSWKIMPTVTVHRQTFSTRSWFDNRRWIWRSYDHYRWKTNQTTDMVCAYNFRFSLYRSQVLPNWMLTFLCLLFDSFSCVDDNRDTAGQEAFRFVDTYILLQNCSHDFFFKR